MTIEIDLGGHVVLVTGATGNIGEAIARTCTAAGAIVAVHSTSRPGDAERLAAELGGMSVIGDLQRDAAAIVERVLHRFGRVDALVNNAAVQPIGDVATVEMWRVNVDGTVALSELAAASMASMGGGAICTISSIDAARPAVGAPAYAATKAAVETHAAEMAHRWGPSDVRVNVVRPGLIHRDGIGSAWPDGVRRWEEANPIGRLGRPQDVADAVVFLCSPLASWITGAVLTVDGGMSTAPGW
jgi:3-oxoacyl-[acyl-carrier protein] reductase